MLPLPLLCGGEVITHVGVRESTGFYTMIPAVAILTTQIAGAFVAKRCSADISHMAQCATPPTSRDTPHGRVVGPPGTIRKGLTHLYMGLRKITFGLWVVNVLSSLLMVLSLEFLSLPRLNKWSRQIFVDKVLLLT